MADKRKTGKKYEELAVRYLSEDGYDIRAKNYQDRYGEIDIIAAKGGVLVACEVKYRRNTGYGDPMEAVDLRKQRKICRTMMHYLVHCRYRDDTPCRFDVIAVYGDETIRHIKNAFEFRS